MEYSFKRKKMFRYIVLIQDIKNIELNSDFSSVVKILTDQPYPTSLHTPPLHLGFLALETHLHIRTLRQEHKKIENRNLLTLEYEYYKIRKHMLPSL